MKNSIIERSSIVKTMDPPIILRDRLAIDRTRLANRRTLLAFIRTGLYFIITCLGILKFGEAEWLSWFGWLFMGIGIVFISIGIVSYQKVRRKILNSYNNVSEAMEDD